eukprot:gene14525-30917_t
MFRSINRLAVSSYVVFTVLRLERSFCEYELPFDTKGLSRKFSVGSSSLTLAAVGMRKKKILFIDVDIYLVGVGLSPSAFRDTRAWKNSNKSSSLVGTLMPSTAEDVAKKGTNLPKILITLRFVRDVSMKQIVQAFVDAFNECNKKDSDAFTTALVEAMGDSGMKAGEELSYCWLEKGGLILARNGEQKNTISNPIIEKHLLEVYLDPKRTVSPELLQCLEAHIDEISE